ncbi:MAG: M56 family metallopeptidase [Ruminococcus sp.]|nr:M56 family metallopeptidase [Ruminococcus sp.]
MTEFFRTVLNMSITAAYICIFVMLLRLFMKKLPAKFSYFLWIIPFIRMICPFSVETAFSVFNLIKPTAESYISESVEYDQTPVIDTGIPLPSSPENITVPLPEAVPENSANPVQIMLFVGTIIWLAGIVGIAVYTAVCVIRLRKRLSNARPLQDNIMICDSIETPFVFGIIKPKIYLPEDISVEDMPFILAHEQAHIRRKDHIIKPLAFAALTVHWFNPLLWLSFKLMERDMELSCDETAVESFSEDVRKDYASALLNISMKQNHLSGGQVISFGENSVKSRIKGVLNWKKPTVIAVCAAVLLIISAAAVLLTDGNSKTETVEPVPDGGMTRYTYVGEVMAVSENGLELISTDETWSIGKLISNFSVPDHVRFSGSIGEYPRNDEWIKCLEILPYVRSDDEIPESFFTTDIAEGKKITLVKNNPNPDGNGKIKRLIVTRSGDDIFYYYTRDLGDFSLTIMFPTFGGNKIFSEEMMMNIVMSFEFMGNSEVPSVPAHEAKMSVSAEYDKQSNKLTITSESIDGTSVMTGSPYTIERLENGEYVPVFPVQPVPDNYVTGFTSEGISLGGEWQESFTRSYAMTDCVLYNGTYRISKTYCVKKDNADRTAYCTLEITDGMLSPENAAAEKLLTAEQKAAVLDISSPEITPMCFYDFSDSDNTQNQLCYRVTYKTNSADITLFISAFDGSPCLTAE